VLMAAVVTVSAFWPSGEPKGALKDAELTWIGRYYDWEAGSSSCESLPAAPTDRFRRIARRARAACRAEEDWNAVDEAIWEHFFLTRPLPMSPRVTNESHINVPLGRVASRMAEQTVKVRCWSVDDWRRVNREYRTAFPDVHYWVAGIGDSQRHVIHLEGALCPTLVGFFGSAYTPSRSIDRADLAEALAVLAHEVEHIRDLHFANSEAVVECFAVQRIRDLVRGEGRSAAFAADIAGYVWDVSYRSRDPVYYTDDCRNGGPLDRHPTSDLWP
jgi:hypothetical protein